MNWYREFDPYNGDTIHNMDADSYFNETTSELPEYFDEANADDFINNLKDRAAAQIARLLNGDRILGCVFKKIAKFVADNTGLRANAIRLKI